jgi:hypothetical protein
MTLLIHSLKFLKVGKLEVFWVGVKEESFSESEN